MIDELKDLIFKEATEKYVNCHNELRQIIADNVGVADSEVIDKIMYIIIKNYRGLSDEKNI